MIFPFINKRLFNKLILEALLVSGGFIIILCYLFKPLWETNDDVGMSMIAHGYGMSAIGMPHIIFSNILWGYLVHSIPTVHGIVGYSIATFSILFIIGSVIFYSLYRLKASYLVSLSALILILTRPVLFPQFTLNAGLLLMSSIALWYVYAIQNNWKLLFLGSVLAFFSYLIRSQEFLFVLLVALPLLPWQTFFSNKSSRIILINFILLFSVIIGAAFLDRNAYKGEEWKSFHELNHVRSLFTDFSFGERLKQHPDILSENGYTANDLDLLKSFFFVDATIANPTKLKAMISKLGLVPSLSYSFKNGWLGIKNLWYPTLMVTLLAAVLLALIHPGWKLALSWGIFITGLFFLGFLGRPGVLRVYLPVLDLLVLAPFLNTSPSTWRRYLSSGVLLITATIALYLCATEAKTTSVASEKIAITLSHFSSSPIIVWGADLPYEKIYSAIESNSTILPYQFYALGCFTLAPFSIAYTQQKAGKGMVDLLASGQSISIIATKNHLDLLKIYCKEHLNQELQEVSKKQFCQDVEIIECRCKPFLSLQK